MAHEGQGYKLVHVNGEGLTPTNALREVDSWIAGSIGACFQQAVSITLGALHLTVTAHVVLDTALVAWQGVYRHPLGVVNKSMCHK